MTPKLVVTSGKSAGRTISMKREKLLVGRADECDVRPLSEEVSRRHCAFRVEADTVFVEDLKSRNGTFVNGVRIEGRRTLADGDIVRIGNLELKVASRAAADASSHKSAPGSGAAAFGSGAAPGNGAAASGDEDEVSRWLMADDEPAGMFDTTRAMRVANEQTVPIPPEAAPKNTAAAETTSENPDATVVRSRTPAPAAAAPSAGQKKAADTSRAAAAEALKKFFGNR